MVKVALKQKLTPHTHQLQPSKSDSKRDPSKLRGRLTS